ncbi:MAG: hypothetical protein V4726_14385 [Verrucomicrobiota bacterium]
MKTKLALLSLAFVSQSAAADLYITGATAFRSAAIKAICASYSATGFVAAYNDGTSLTGANRSVFRGTFNGIAGTTTIYCSWNGSVEGIKALARNEDVSFINNTPTVAAGTDATGGGAIANLDLDLKPTKAQLAFSDVFKSSTPYGTATLFPSNAKVGVVAFAWVAHESAVAGLTNVTTQSARAILTQGVQPLNLFTGLDADKTSNVFLTGRNDGSGTRTTVLAEAGYPITQAVHQYKSNSDGTTVSSLRVWPTGDGPNASLIWPPAELEGNGGFSSGSGVTNVMKAVSAGAGVTVYEADGTTVAFTPAAVSILGYQSTKDAKDSLDGGGRVLSYNGFPVTYTGSDISAATRKSIINGQYTLWGYEHLYARVAINASSPQNDLDRLYQTIRNGCTAANLGNSGIPLSEMTVVARASDGGVVAP